MTARIQSSSGSRAAGLHEDLNREHRVRTSSDRSFGFVFAAFLLVVAMWPLLKGGTPRWIAFAASLCFLAAALVRPAVLGPLNRVWTRLGLTIGKITNPVIIGLTFYGVFTPLGLLLRLFRKDPLGLRATEATESYWIPRPPEGRRAGSMRNQF